MVKQFQQPMKNFSLICFWDNSRNKTNHIIWARDLDRVRKCFFVCVCSLFLSVWHHLCLLRDVLGDEGYRYSDIEFQWRSPLRPLFQSFQWRSYWYGERIHGLSGISGARCWPLPASWWLMFQSSPWSFSLSKGRHCFFVNAFSGKKSENIFDEELPTANLSW